MIRALALGLLAATAVSSAMAADLIVEEDVAEVAMAAAYDWNGGYVGAFGGYGWGDTTWDGIGLGQVPFDLTGWIAGVDVGANFQTGSFVLGVEGDVAWTNMGGSAGCPPGLFECSTDINWLATLRARAGFAADAVLVYATAGVAAADVTSDSPPFTPDLAFDSTYFGWTAGAGVEVGVSEQVSLKAEYLYTDLGSQTDTDDILDIGDVEVPIAFHSVRVGANFHF